MMKEKIRKEMREKMNNATVWKRTFIPLLQGTLFTGFYSLYSLPLISHFFPRFRPPGFFEFILRIFVMFSFKFGSDSASFIRGKRNRRSGLVGLVNPIR